MSVADTVLDKLKGSRWHSVFIGGMIAVAFWAFTGPAVNWAMSAYASETLDIMLLQRGITPDAFKDVQKKLKEIDAQTDGLKQDLKKVNDAIIVIAQKQEAISRELDAATVRSKEERKELKEAIDTIYRYLLKERKI